MRTEIGLNKCEHFLKAFMMNALHEQVGEASPKWYQNKLKFSPANIFFGIIFYSFKKTDIFNNYQTSCMCNLAIF